MALSRFCCATVSCAASASDVAWSAAELGRAGRPGPSRPRCPHLPRIRRPGSPRCPGSPWPAPRRARTAAGTAPAGRAGPRSRPPAPAWWRAHRCPARAPGWAPGEGRPVWAWRRHPGPRRRPGRRRRRTSGRRAAGHGRSARRGCAGGRRRRAGAHLASLGERCPGPGQGLVGPVLGAQHGLLQRPQRRAGRAARRQPEPGPGPAPDPSEPAPDPEPALAAARPWPAMSRDTCRFAWSRVDCAAASAARSDALLERAEPLPGGNPLAGPHRDRGHRAADRERDVGLLCRAERAYHVDRGADLRRGDGGQPVARARVRTRWRRPSRRPRGRPGRRGRARCFAVAIVGIAGRLFIRCAARRWGPAAQPGPPDRRRRSGRSRRRPRRAGHRGPRKRDGIR